MDGTRALSITVISLGGETLLQVDMQAEARVAELEDRLQPILGQHDGAPVGGITCTFEAHTMAGGSPFRTVDLVHDGEVLVKDARLGEVVTESNQVTVTAVVGRGLKVPAVDLHGADTDDASYFCRLNAGSDDEILWFQDGCWFQVGGTFTRVPAGKYRVILEAAQIGGRSFDIKVEPPNTIWNPQSILTEHIKECEVAQIELAEPADELRVWLWNTDGSWKDGFQLKSMSLMP